MSPERTIFRAATLGVRFGQKLVVFVVFVFVVFVFVAFVVVGVGRGARVGRSADPPGLLFGHFWASREPGPPQRPGATASAVRLNLR